MPETTEFDHYEVLRREDGDQCDGAGMVQGQAFGGGKGGAVRRGKFEIRNSKLEADGTREARQIFRISDFEFRI
jgi:hypothetical protein